MSVPSWKRSISKTEYIRLLFELNIRIGEIVANSPKKYRANYGDFLVKSALEALKYAQIANSIFVSSSMTEADYNLRRGLLQQARGIVEISQRLDIFFWNRPESMIVRSLKRSTGGRNTWARPAARSPKRLAQS